MNPFIMELVLGLGFLATFGLILYLMSKAATTLEIKTAPRWHRVRFHAVSWILALFQLLLAIFFLLPILLNR